MTEEKEVHFWELPSTTRFELQNDFRRKLFDDTDLDMHELSKLLSVSYPYICQLRRGTVNFIPKDLLMKISTLAQYNLKAVEKHIIKCRTRGGHAVECVFPVVSNEAIASLVGHVFGDGSICRSRREFDYGNTNPYLVESVQSKISSIFKVESITKNRYRVSFPSMLGDILLSFGAPQAPKLYSRKLVPNWIMRSSRAIKQSFLKALFDDDGSVMYSRKYRAKGVNLSQTRHIKMKKDLEIFMAQVKKLLGDLQINSSKPLVSRTYAKKDGEHIVMYLNITDFQSILIFNQLVGLSEGRKKQKLQTIISRGVYYSKGQIKNLEFDLINVLQDIPFSTRQIADKVQKQTQKVLERLKKLETNGKVERVGRVAPNRAYLWKLNEVKG